MVIWFQIKEDEVLCFWVRGLWIWGWGGSDDGGWVAVVVGDVGSGSDTCWVWVGRRMKKMMKICEFSFCVLIFH